MLEKWESAKWKCAGRHFSTALTRCDECIDTFVLQCSPGCQLCELKLYLNKAESMRCGFNVPLELQCCRLQGIDIHMLNFHRQEVYLKQAEMYCPCKWVYTDSKFCSGRSVGMQTCKVPKQTYGALQHCKYSMCCEVWRPVRLCNKCT